MSSSSSAASRPRASPLRRSESIVNVNVLDTFTQFTERRVRRKAMSTPKPKLTPPAQVILPSVSSPRVELRGPPRTTSPLAPHPPKLLPGRPIFPGCRSSRSSSPSSQLSRTSSSASLSSLTSLKSTRRKKKHEAENLYKTALKTRLKLGSIEGRQVVEMGMSPRVVMGVPDKSPSERLCMRRSRLSVELGKIMDATRELEEMLRDSEDDRMCVDSEPSDSCIQFDPRSPKPTHQDPPRSVYAPLVPRKSTSASALPLRRSVTSCAPVLTASWVVVRGNDDWEMVDRSPCVA